MFRRTLLLLLLALGATPAQAGTEAYAPRLKLPDTMQGYAQDLVGEDAANRVLAARALRRRIKVELRGLRGPAGSVSRMEALADLADYDNVVAPACIEGLSVANTRRPCADILRMLETRDALPALAAARDAEPRKGVRRRLDRALISIQAAHGVEPERAAP